MNGEREHPRPEILERFLLAELPAAEGRLVLRHLLTGCAECQETAARLWERLPGRQNGKLGMDRELDAEYDRVLDRVFRRVAETERSLARERAQAKQLIESLQKHPIERQRILLHNSPRFRNPALCEQLLEASHHAGFENPKRAIELAETALEVVRLLEETSDKPARSRNLEARSWAQLAAARRIQGDLRGAEDAFRQAEEAIELDGVSLFDEARLWDIKASIKREQRRFPEALSLHDRIIAIYQSLGQRHLLGRAFAQKAMVIYEIGDYESAIAILRRALELLDPKEEPRMFLAARHNLIVSLCESDRHREAFALLFHTRPYYLQTGDRMNLLRMRWLEGRIAAGLGRAEQAEVAYREVGAAFAELDLAYDNALVSLDLAALCAQQGRAAEVRRIAEEVLEVFRSRGVHREAIAAVALLCQATEREKAQATLVRRVSNFLKRSRGDRELQFQADEDVR